MTVSEICLNNPGMAWTLVPTSSLPEIRETTAPESDLQLAQRLRARDRQVVPALYDRYGRTAYAVVFRMVRNTAVAEDLVQEVFLRVWNGAASFDPERGALSTWIVTVARNRAIDYLRSVDGRMAANMVNLDDAPVRASFPSLEDDVLSINRTRRLKKAFEKLTDRQKKVIEMAYYEGLSQTEMASRLKQPLGTVKTWVRTALTVLKKELV